MGNPTNQYAINVISVGIFTSCIPRNAPKATTCTVSDIWKTAAISNNFAAIERSGLQVDYGKFVIRRNSKNRFNPFWFPTRIIAATLNPVATINVIEDRFKAI